MVVAVSTNPEALSVSARRDLGDPTASRLWAPAKTALPACITALARRLMGALAATSTSPAYAVAYARGATVRSHGHLAHTGAAPTTRSAEHSFGAAVCLGIERILPLASACGCLTAHRLRTRVCTAAHATTPSRLHLILLEDSHPTSASVLMASGEITASSPSPVTLAISTPVRMEPPVARTSGGLCASVCLGTRGISAS